MVFARTPVPGRVKRRLIPALGPQGAMRLHERMTRKTVVTAVESGIGPVTLWGFPQSGHPFFARLRDEHDLQLREQRGANLGERMENAFLRTMPEAHCAIIVGTDCPFLERGDLETTAQALVQDRGAIIGPAADGGYYLLGLSGREPAAALFRDIEWGGAQVLETTRGRLRELGMSWRELALRPDIDRPEDLDLLREVWDETELGST